MDLLNREIYILKLLVQERSITKAAERAGLQQPAVSKILSQIEHKLERKLFFRTSGGLKPSTFAVDLARLAEEAQINWDNSLANLLQKEKRIEGIYSLGCHPVIAKTYLTKVYPKLLNRFPLLTLDIKLEPSKVVTQKVANGDLHFGLVANPVRQPELVIKTINAEAVYLYQNGKLSKNSVVYYNPDMLDVGRLIRALKGYKLVSIQDYQLMLAMVLGKAGQGAILPSPLAETASLTVASKAYLRPEIKLIYRKDLQKSPAVEAILQELKDLTP